MKSKSMGKVVKARQLLQRSFVLERFDDGDDDDDDDGDDNDDSLQMPEGE